MGSLRGDAVQRDFLQNGLPDAAYDFVVSIGCLHHTGDLARAVAEVHRILKPGGTAVIMVYSRFSLRQWLRWPGLTLQALAPGARPATAAQREAYDAHVAGGEAPATEFSSRRELRGLFRSYAAVRIRAENCDPLTWRGRVISRERLLPWLGPLLGLDLYVTAVK
jgi:SAM-dependent methyltransferase